MFTLRPTSGTPIYRQLVDQVRQLAASGRLEAGDQLPTVRAVASELGVNPVTISKAYSLLEREGVVSQQPGADVVMAQTRVGPLQAMRPQALALVTTAKRLGFSREDTLDTVDRLWTSQQEA